MSKSIL
jgi:hypothetical protein